MKKLFVTLLMSFNVCFGQNLVPNQSFELTGVIPCDWSQSSIQFNNSTVDWNSPTLGTPDIYSTTINSNCPNFQPNSDYPLCFNGTQLPHSGNTFAGIYINDNQCSFCREYLQIQLTNPMIVGSKYYVEMYVSLADYSKFASNNIGVGFSNSYTNLAIYSELGYMPQLLFSNVITDTANWVLLTDSIIPSQPYEYIIIGNFFNGASTNSVLVNPNGCINNTYYYFDDIKIYPDTCYINLGDDIILCNEESITINATTPNATYLWNDGSTNSTYITAEEGNYWVTVTVNSCSWTDSINVIINPEIIIDLGNDQTLCQGDTVTLEATTQGCTYSWQDDSTEPVFIVSQGGDYFVEVNFNNCIYSDTVHIEFNPLPIINLGNDTSICVGDTLILDATNSNSTYLWQNNSSLSSLQVFEEAIYWVIVTTNNCNNSDSIEIKFNPLPSINLGYNAIVCDYDSLILDVSTPNAYYMWQDSSTFSSFLVTNPGTYWVLVTLNNCSSIDSITFSIDNCDAILELPNIITANNDGINDYFIPIKSDGISSMKTYILNRWGNLVYETENPLIEWDGNNVNEGTYYWIIIYFDHNKIENKTSGFVVVER